MTWRLRTARREAEGGCLREVHLKSFNARLAVDYPAYSMVICQVRVLSHLALCFGTWHVSLLSSVRLGICEHGNRARIRAKTIGPRSPERGGPGSIEMNSGAVRL